MSDRSETRPLVERRLREALDIATDALRAQRYDLHADDGRPCGSCSRASRALATIDAIRIWHDAKVMAGVYKQEDQHLYRPPFCPICGFRPMVTWVYAGVTGDENRWIPGQLSCPSCLMPVATSCGPNHRNDEETTL